MNIKAQGRDFEIARHFDKIAYIERRWTQDRGTTFRAIYPERIKGRDFETFEEALVQLYQIACEVIGTNASYDKSMLADKIGVEIVKRMLGNHEAS